MADSMVGGASMPIIKRNKSNFKSVHCDDCGKLGKEVRSVKDLDTNTIYSYTSNDNRRKKYRHCKKCWDKWVRGGIL